MLLRIRTPAQFFQTLPHLEQRPGHQCSRSGLRQDALILFDRTLQVAQDHFLVNRRFQLHLRILTRSRRSCSRDQTNCNQHNQGVRDCRPE